MSALFGTLRCNNSLGDSDEKLPPFNLPEIRAQALSFESLVSFSRIHQNKTKNQNRWTLKSVLNRNDLFLVIHMFDEQWIVLIKLPLVFSLKRYLKAHNHDRRLKENYKQYSVTSINLLQYIGRQIVYSE